MRKVTKKSRASEDSSTSPKNNNMKKDVAPPASELESPNADATDAAATKRKPEDGETSRHNDDQIQTVSTFDVLNDTSNTDGFNPKYQGRLKASTGMFPTYHPTYEDKKVQRTMRKQAGNFI